MPNICCLCFLARGNCCPGAVITDPYCMTHRVYCFFIATDSFAFDYSTSPGIIDISRIIPTEIP